MPVRLTIEHDDVPALAAPAATVPPRRLRRLPEQAWRHAACHLQQGRFHPRPGRARTRAAVLRFAREAQMEVEERNFTIDEAKAADEAFITSASAFVMPVVEVDGAPVGTGTVGRVATRLREIYLEEMRKAAV
mgnify:CR=1 FL=1